MIGEVYMNPFPRQGYTTGADASKQVLDDVEFCVKQLESRHCPHENTHRRGVIWTVCDDCGATWADDEGPPKSLDVAPLVRLSAWIKEQRQKPS